MYTKKLVSDALVDAVRQITRKEITDSKGNVISSGDSVIVREGDYKGKTGIILESKTSTSVGVILDKGRKLEFNTSLLELTEKFDKKSMKKEKKEKDSEDDSDKKDSKKKNKNPFAKKDSKKEKDDDDENPFMKKSKKKNKKDDEDEDDDKDDDKNDKKKKKSSKDEIKINPKMEESSSEVWKKVLSNTAWNNHISSLKKSSNLNKGRNE